MLIVSSGILGITLLLVLNIMGVVSTWWPNVSCVYEPY